MLNRDEPVNKELLKQLPAAVAVPPGDALAQSRRRVQNWFAQTAPLIQWGTVESPLGPIYIAASAHGVCSVNFGVSLNVFLNKLDPLACAEWKPQALEPAAQQLREYFAGVRSGFDLPVDLRRLSSFQQNVLQVARNIPAGTVWTYGQVARTLGKPQAGRAIGQALGHNPVPIIIPCHRVIASDGSLGGYSGGGGLNSKRLLLRLEGALTGLNGQN